VLRTSCTEVELPGRTGTSSEPSSAIEAEDAGAPVCGHLGDPRVSGGAEPASLIPAMISASPASALPRACDTIGHRADVYFGYAQAEYAVGDTAAGDRWMTAYYGQIGFLIAYGC
jgi:hypothetical protein